MKKLTVAVCLLLLSRGLAASGVDVFRAGLAAFQINGPDALLNTWYSAEEEDRRSDLRKRLAAMTTHLGQVMDTEVFAPKDLGRHVQRLYGVIYFKRRPIWIRADYYSIDGQNGFISLEFSPSPNDILPIEFAMTKP